MLDNFCFIVVIFSPSCVICSSSNVEADQLTLLQFGRHVSSKAWPNQRADEGTSALNTPSGLTNGTVATDMGTSLALDSRPGIAARTVDTIQFGILIKKWYGIDLPGNTFSVDAVLILRWLDPRTSKMLPPHSTSITLSTERASALIWLPDIVVTNVENKGTHRVSETISISSSGEVTRMARTLLTLKQEFETQDFPFDTQNVSVVLASATYLRNELQLVPINDNNAGMIGVSEHVFDNSIWCLIDSDVRSVIEDDGMLKKSRGVLSLKVKRKANEYVSEIFVPSAVFLVMTWSAHWLPSGGPYVMPRVAINAFALLCQVSISRGATSMVPATGNPAWLFDYLELCTELQFVVMLITIIIIRAEQSDSSIDQTLNWDMLVSYPITTSVNIFVLSIGFRQASRFLLLATIFGYIAYLFFQLRQKRG